MLKKNIIKKQEDMKAIRLLATTLLCAATTVTVNAQENLKKAIDSFINDKSLSEYFHRSNYLENTGPENKVSSFCDQYVFELPMNKKKELNPVLNAFKKDTDVAYNVYYKDAGIDNNRLTNIAYGGKLDKSISFGAHKDRNYRIMLVQDPKDSLRRYCYAIIWYENEDNGKFCGSINVIYSLNPQKVKNNTTTYINLGDLEQLKELEKLKDLDVLKKLGSGTYEVQSGDMQDNNEIKTSTDFFRRLSSLRATFMKSRSTNKDDVRTVLANKILELCREHGKLLNQEERKFCIRSIEDMQMREWDVYIKGLFDIAISDLKK